VKEKKNLKHFKINIPVRRFVMTLAMAGGLAFLLTACAGPKKEIAKTVFFPPPPDEPRLQFLTSFKDSNFLEEKSTFKLIVTGQEQEEPQITVDKPLGIATYKGVIYICDTHQATILRIDVANKRFESIRGNAGPGKLNKPVNLTIDESGKLYVADVVRNEVMVYTADGDFVRAIGRNLNMKKLAGVAVGRENIYLLDNAASIVKVIDKTSFQFLRDIGTGKTEDDSLWRPFAMTLDSQGYLYVSNIGTCKVLKMDADGHVLLSFGKQGDAPGEFARPRGVAVDPEGRIWVVDAAFQNVQIFNDKGKLLLFFGDPGLPHGSMNLPAGIAITSDKIDYFQKFADPSFEVERLVFVTNQSGDDKVAVYGFGHLKGGSEVKPATGSPPAGVTAR
jgi:DNA-binding beta-propeller fold protein YncE